MFSDTSNSYQNSGVSSYLNNDSFPDTLLPSEEVAQAFLDGKITRDEMNNLSPEAEKVTEQMLKELESGGGISLGSNNNLVLTSQAQEVVNQTFSGLG